MNIIDIIVLSITAISFICGLFGKWIRKVGDFIVFIVSIVAAYIVALKINIDVNSFDLSTVFPTLSSGTTLTSYIESLSFLPSNITASAIVAMATTIIRLFVFWILALLIMLVLNIIAKIVFTIVFSIFKKNTAWHTFGILGAIKGFILGIMILLPIYMLSPVLANISSFPGLNDYVSDANIALVEDQFKSENSFTIKMMDFIFTKTDLSIMNYEYTDSENNKVEGNIYSDVKTIPDFLEIASTLTDVSSENLIDSIVSMDDDKITSLCNDIENSPTMKETVVSTLETVLKQQDNIEVDLSDVDFSKEANTLIALKNFIKTDNNSKINEETFDSLISSINESKLVYEIAKASPGVLAKQFTSTQIAAVELELLNLKAANKINDDQYNVYLSLFKETVNKLCVFC